MTKHPWRLIAALAFVLVVAVAVAAVVVAGSDARTLDGATLLGDEVGEEALAGPSGATLLPSETFDGISMNEAHVLVPRDDRSFFVLLQQTLVVGTGTGRVVDATLAPTSLLLGLPTAFSTVGDQALAFPASSSGSPTGGSLVQLLPRGAPDPDLDDVPDLHAAFDVGALAFLDERSLLVADRDEVRIDVLTVDGSTSRLLGGSDDADAAVRWDGLSGTIVALLALPDDRVVFVLSTDEEERLFVLDDTRVREVDTGAANPVHGIARTEPIGDEEMSPIFTPLTAGPDGQVITIGLADDGHPLISVVDVDSGNVEVLADLEGVEPEVIEPVSAVAVGDDLVFLAQDKLWRKDGVL